MSRLSAWWVVLLRGTHRHTDCEKNRRGRDSLTGRIGLYRNRILPDRCNTVDEVFNIVVGQNWPSGAM